MNDFSLLNAAGDITQKTGGGRAFARGPETSLTVKRSPARASAVTRKHPQAIERELKVAAAPPKADR